jgi:hypothetical protein
MAQAANDAGLHHKTWSLGLEQYAMCLSGLLAGYIGMHAPLPQDLMQVLMFGCLQASELNVPPQLSECMKTTGSTTPSVHKHVKAKQLSCSSPAQQRAHTQITVLRVVRELVGAPVTWSQWRRR